jgi:hypothetical protein
MDKENKIFSEDNARSFPEVHVPGIEQVIEQLRQEYPLLSEEAICRILGLIPKGTCPIQQESRMPETAKSTQITEVKE